MQLNSLEEEVITDVAFAEEVIEDVVNAAVEYNNPDIHYNFGYGTGKVHHGEKINNPHNNIYHPAARAIIYQNYSMAPINILNRAGVDHTAGFVPSMTGRQARQAMKKDEDLRQQATLPTLDEIQSLYGNHSYIVGLERCEEYRASVPPDQRIMGPAGMFNSATNLLNKLLKLNCVNEDRLSEARAKGYRGAGQTGMMLQAPWGKHNPVSWRNHHEAKVGGKGVHQTDFVSIHGDDCPCIIVVSLVIAKQCIETYTLIFLL